jgi:serine/threonine protein kinase
MNSEVFEAREIGIDRIVAVKELDKAYLRVLGISEYFREARMLFAARHRHVVEIYTAVETADIVALLMPLYPAGSLATRIQNGPLRLRQGLRVAHDVLDGLGRIHALNLVHFDLKPSNVLFARDGRAMVADFGQTRMLDARGVAEEPGMYPYAVPPEVERFHAGTSQSDIWQMGLLLYRIVNGDPFYRVVKDRQLVVEGGAAACRRSGKIVDLGMFQPHVPHSIRRVIRKALDPNPADRYGSAAELSDALGRLDFNLDWEMTESPDVTTWHAERPRQPALVVEKQRVGTRWNVQVYTEGRAGRRALQRDLLWADRLTDRQAEVHLRTKVFAILSRR